MKKKDEIKTVDELVKDQERRNRKVLVRDLFILSAVMILMIITVSIFINFGTPVPAPVEKYQNNWNY